jgi:hypothetical protein
MQDPKKPEETAAKAKPAPKDEKADPSAPKKPGYVFKIVSADPKNAFNFEDVADK